jgi:hypothetical protein
MDSKNEAFMVFLLNPGHGSAALSMAINAGSTDIITLATGKASACQTENPAA